LLFEDGGDKVPTSWSPDGQFILYSRPDEKTKVFHIWVLPLGGGESGSPLKPFQFVQTPADERTGRFSPDGKWILYQSDESGRSEVYLAPFHPKGSLPGGKRQVSTAGGGYPRWREDGKEIFYQRGRSLVAAAVEIKGGTVQVGEEREVLGPLSIQGYDVSADGQRFVVVARSRRASSRPLTVVENWMSGLRK
jgi:Tol biopolymer transport system component